MSKLSPGDNGSYYDFPKAATQAIELIEMYDANFNMGTVLKCWVRIMAEDESHSNTERDLRKIMWSIQREIDRLGPQQPVESQPAKSQRTYASATCQGCGMPFGGTEVTHCPACGTHRSYFPL